MHILQLIAHYESYPTDSGDTLQFTAELIFDCDRIPYDLPTIDNYEYVIDHSDPVVSVLIDSTYCGSWIYDFDATTYKKNFPWCDWCAYSNFGLFEFDPLTYTIFIKDAAGFDTGNYEISIPIYVPNSDVEEFIEFEITISFCQILNFIVEPVEDSSYVAFEQEAHVIEITDYIQEPACNYSLFWTWRYVDPETGNYLALPNIFSANERTIQVQTDNALEDAGVYQFYVKAAVSILVLFPEVKHEEFIFIEVVDPCKTTTINSDRKL